MAVASDSTWLAWEINSEANAEDDELKAREKRRKAHQEKARLLEEEGPPAKRPRRRPRKQKQSKEAKSSSDNNNTVTPDLTSSKRKKKTMPESQKKRQCTKKSTAKTAAGDSSLGDVSTSRKSEKKRRVASKNRRKVKALASAAVLAMNKSERLRSPILSFSSGSPICSPSPGINLSQSTFNFCIPDCLDFPECPTSTTVSSTLHLKLKPLDRVSAEKIGEESGSPDRPRSPDRPASTTIALKWFNFATKSLRRLMLSNHG